MFLARSFRIVGLLTVAAALFGALASAQEEDQSSKPTRNTRRARANAQKEKKEKSPKGVAKKIRKPGGEMSILEKALTEYALTGEEIDALVGKNVNLLMTNGKRADDVKLAKFLKARDADRVRTVNVETEGTSGKSSTRGYACKTLFRMELDKHPYEFRYIDSQKSYAIIDVDKRNQAINAQLESKGRKLWEPISEVQQEKFVADRKQDLEDVRKHFPQLPLTLRESKYFLFLSDMPPNDVGPYIAHLDSMNEKLGEAFGFAPGENVWQGKAVVIAFVNKESFLEYENEFFKAKPPDGVQGLCHTFPDGKVVVSFYRGDSPSYFAVVLVHETSHGYMHRYKSNRAIPRWLNEGIADWIAGVAVPESNAVKQRQQDAAERVRRSGTLEGFFNSPMPEPWQYGVGSTIVDLLIRENKDEFRLFFDGIKEGLTWEDSLQRSYGATPEDLLGLYAKTIGAEHVTP